MKFALWTWLLALTVSSLAAQNAGNIEIQFPLSQYDWVLLTDDSGIDEEDGEEYSVQVFTHREGDALELFLIVRDSEVSWDNSPRESVEARVHEEIFQYLPHHSFNLTTYITEHGFLEWEIYDGNIDILHGATRMVPTKNGDLVLAYFTTALKTAENTALWEHVLREARVVE